MSTNKLQTQKTALREGGAVSEASKPLDIRLGMFRAIFTKYLGPTNRRGSRIKAFDCEGFSITLNINHSFSDGHNHVEAARKLCEKMGWGGTLVSGGTDCGQVFVFVEQEPLAETEVLIQFSNREDAETAYKVLNKQAGNSEQTMSGLYASLLRSAVQRAQRVEIGGMQ
jgi:hypothetical protein